ncbi:patatin-like phospholipase family protein [Pseudobdellovibrio exovorus]|uniref:Patatin family protein n=1 Tax=Pseudobdellovibrio exovorus JSS TaxID=1184267 RepID=M4VAQ6_9BACT|nr:patatin-like phospholipase family protein [Pseudobdellovibrio exovorus]AGH95545.1 patatin family protein [Pseudobdellovibrio exovorus JSS]
MSHKTALILSGGGARGAYQAGVLKGLSEILPEKKKSPFQIISGVSAGAINSVKLASELESFSNAIERMTFLWSQMTPDQVFKTDLLSVNRLSLGLFGSGSKGFDALLDTAPLNQLLNAHCDFSGIKRNIDSGNLESLIITSNNYNSGAATSFIQSSSSKLTWKESRRIAQLSEINSDHIMASAAIPMLFPAIRIGSQYYGDGCVRNNTPCSPAIRMGADKLFVVGVRTQLHAETAARADKNVADTHKPSIISIFNTLLNAVLLDSVEQDVQRIQRINQLIDLTGYSGTQNKGFKKIPALCISPSQDLGEIARQHAHRLPRLIRMTISAFGSLDEASEILSYLLFDPHFCRKAIEMGYNDAMDSKSQIEQFFLES